ncbi:phosphoribosyltransferase [Oceanirhabdus sp. W0125-5]|uniref:phosphoribosyltransferase n=1 Tax=Oceanirhabdus sp. W0125-5 TaxID=2999116 RepID=UPI0022F2C481|nr:phosphoribosyltransferase [Oceanirhabdus sp. W0125-5]WBW96328.1 phosphoribosyltransferase [Oceanirhabdus sp. W0125-5]
MKKLCYTEESLLRKTILFKYKFGFVGEAYIAVEEFENDYKQYKYILEKYLSLKEPFYCNRNRSYYSTDLKETINLILSIDSDAKSIINSDMSFQNKQYIIFSLTEYMVSYIGKLLGVCFAHEELKNKYYISLKTYLSQFTDYLVCIIFNEDFKSVPFISKELLDNILCDMQQLHIQEVREYSEMDNIFIMFVTYFVYSDYLKNQDIIISPLQGAVLIPPFYISIQKYINRKVGKDTNINFEYVRLSNYDNSHYCEFSLSQQMKVLKNQYNENANVILLDDNTGTGSTIKGIKQELSKVFINITTGVLECRWDTKLYTSKFPNYPAFHLNDVDLITPLCYRHYKFFHDQIKYIKNSEKLHSWYNNGQFYKLKMIYHEMDYYTYINENCFDDTIKNRLLDIYENFKYIEEKIEKWREEY